MISSIGRKYIFDTYGKREWDIRYVLIMQDPWAVDDNLNLNLKVIIILHGWIREHLIPLYTYHRLYL